MVRTLTLCLLLLLAPAPARANDTKPEAKPKLTADCCCADIEGIYHVQGDNYGGVLKVRKLGDAYYLEWFLSADDPGDGKTINLSYTMSGVGMRQGMKLHVGWTMPGKGEPVRGVSVYDFAEVGGVLQASGKAMSLPGGGAKEKILRLRRFTAKAEVE